MENEGIVLGHLVRKHKHRLTKDLSARDFLQLNFVKLNRKAKVLAKVDLRIIQKKQMVKI